MLVSTAAASAALPLRTSSTANLRNRPATSSTVSPIPPQRSPCGEVASGEHLVEQQAETFLFRRAELAGHGRDKATYFRGQDPLDSAGRADEVAVQSGYLSVTEASARAEKRREAAAAQALVAESSRRGRHRRRGRLRDRRHAATPA
jgi:hypothetical protein